MSAPTPIRVLGPQFAPSWHRPQFRYFAPVEGAEGKPNEDPKPDDDLGFPKDTPVEQMKPEEQAAYWKNQSKTQQKAREDAEKARKAYEAFGTPDELQSAKDAAEKARLDALGDSERALEEAKNAGRAEGIAQTANQHLASGVRGMLVAITKTADESFEDAVARVDAAIGFADLTKFIGDDGELDAAKVQTFAQSTGSAGGNGPQSGGNNWGDRFRHDHDGRVTPTPGSTGSVASMEQAAYDAMKPKTA
ncbi:hypothetical protein [Microbacterium sp. K24]|uniref:hypothetical protein n=1 Tax=Microbacterium sp. K24 TaxID=2305446 RepID=UPI00109CE97B|nr:hypothetical protein [Microbacterium sp. K24]